MFNRIIIDLAFEQEGHAIGLREHAKGLLQHASIINPGQIDEERGSIQYQHCFHDEDPSKECEVISLDLVPDATP